MNTNLDYGLQICKLIKRNLCSLKVGAQNQFVEKIGLNERYYISILKKDFIDFRLETLIMISNSLDIQVNELVSNNLMYMKKGQKEKLSNHIKNIANTLKNSRKSKALTQREFAKQLDISLRLYIDIEQTTKEDCERYPNLKLSTILKISNYLKITIETLLEYREDL